MKRLLKKLVLFVLPLVLIPLFFVAFFQLSNPVYALPNGFIKQKVAEGFDLPTDFAFAPDGRIFVTEQSGNIKVVQNGAILSDSAISLSVPPAENRGEKGVLGIALDDHFTANRYVYVVYVNGNPEEIRVSRFTENSNKLTNETVLLKSTQPLGLVHHSGTVRVGADGKLWVTIGNNGNPSNPQDLSHIHGKLLRLNKDGSVPLDNPFVAQSGANPYIWAYGLRNPFRFNFLPDGRPIIGDVGDTSYEEINIGVKGGNFGYPTCEGVCSGQPFIQPAYTYPRGATASVTGGFVYTGTQFPEEYRGNYFFGDYSQRFIKRLVFDQNGNIVKEEAFDDSAGSVVELLQGPDGSLYYIQIYGNGYPSPGTLWKVSAGGNQPPIAKIQADKLSGAAPLTVGFSSNGSVDPEGNSLSYSWEFGDGSSSIEANPTHTYQNKGVYKAVLKVSDGVSTSSGESLDIAVDNNYPEPVILLPDETIKYKAGQKISYSGYASDKEDGQLTGNSFSWTVVFHHNTHVHPFVGPVIGSTTGEFTIPDTGEPAADTWYEIQLKVTDSSGLSRTVSKNIYPQVVKLTFDTVPSGLEVLVDGVPVNTPHTIDAVSGFKRVLDLRPIQNRNGENFQFTSWSDNGAKSHEIVTPTTNITYKANFKSTGTGTGNLRFRIPEFNEIGRTGGFINGATVKLTDQSGNLVYASSFSGVQNAEDGWVFFDNIPTGTYGILAYKTGYEGIWRQVDCNTLNGSFENASILNANTDGKKAAWDSTATIVSGQTTVCEDLGLLIATKGNLYLRVMEIDPKSPGVQKDYSIVGFLNDVTVKLTNQSGDQEIASLKTYKSGNEDGWAFFNAVPVGTHGLMAYKDGYKGYLKQYDCNGNSEVGSTIQNALSEQKVAAWNNAVPITGGSTTYCYDLGLVKETTQGFGNLRFRIAEFDQNDNWTGSFRDGVTVKLTDTTGNTVFKTETSSTKNNESGWVWFDDIPVGTYGIMAYKPGFDGMWKQVNCQTAGGSFTNATINNQHTEGETAAWDNNAIVVANQVTVCEDLGIKNNTSSKGSVRFRVVEFTEDNNWTGNYMNDVTVKLTQDNGSTVISTKKTTPHAGEDGWVMFDDIPAGNYNILAYKEGFEGTWKMGDCTSGGSFSNATIQNQHTEGLTAAYDATTVVGVNKVTVCEDLGLRPIPTPRGRLAFRIADFYQGQHWLNNYINGATVKLTDTTGTTVFQTQSSFRYETSYRTGEDGWVMFENVKPGTYGIMAYKDGYTGVWKQMGCGNGGSTENETIQNHHTDGKVAAWNNTVVVQANTTTVCQDLGITRVDGSNYGDLRFRVREFNNSNQWTGRFINDVPVRIEVYQGGYPYQPDIYYTKSERKNGEDGWVWFNGLEPGNYSIYVDSQEYLFIWAQEDCREPDGTLRNEQSAQIIEGKVTVCEDIGVQKLVNDASLMQKSITSTPITSFSLDTDTASKSGSARLKVDQLELPKQSSESGTSSATSPPVSSATPIPSASASPFVRDSLSEKVLESTPSAE